MTDILLVFVTVGNGDEAATIARTLVEEKLVACVNIISRIRSLYWWKGEVCDDSEFLLLMKTTKAGYEDLERRIRLLHNYEVPEIVAISVEQGLPDYLQWVVRSIR